MSIWDDPELRPAGNYVSFENPGDLDSEITDLWPTHASAFARVKDDGRAESALIARHGWLEMTRSAA